jgi:hypothetical protein
MLIYFCFMKVSFKTWLKEELRNLFKIEGSNRPRVIPLLAGLSTALPLLAGYFLHQFAAGLLASTGGLIALYYTEGKLLRKMTWMISCALGFILSFGAGSLLGFNPFLSCFILALLAFLVNLTLNHYGMKPPGGFLFIIIITIAICMPYDLHRVPLKLALISAGCFCSCFLVLLHHLLFIGKHTVQTDAQLVQKPLRRNLLESCVTALLVGISLALGYGLEVNKPYWIPVTCAAVMQGIDVRHVWQRSFQRFCGTLLGLGIAWIILSFRFTALEICIAVPLLQFFAIFFIARHYGLVTVFFTPVAIFMAEAGSALQADPDQLISARLLDTLLGCALGTLGGWILHDLLLGAKGKPTE